MNLPLILDNSLTVRVKLQNDSISLIEITKLTSQMQGYIVAMDIIQITQEFIIRDFTISAENNEILTAIIEQIKLLEQIEVMHTSDYVFLMHLGGKIEIKNKVPLKTRQDLSMAYTPGVAKICSAIHEDSSKAYNLTIKKNMVAIISDGSAVLGLGNIGPLAALPVMEGKAMLFKEFAKVDAFPICLDTSSTEELIQTIKALAPSFGGINLEDIKAPECFEVERRLQEELDIPVFHDDQHGTAVVLAAGLINALKLVDKAMQDIKVVVSGVGAAGTACSKIIHKLGVKDIIGCDRNGAVYKNRASNNKAKEEYASFTNEQQVKGSLSDAIKGADVFIGVSSPNILSVEDLKNMADDPIVFAMANPDPEIKVELAWPHVRVMATGRSDYPNQINNVLCFPGLFRGVLDCKAKTITENMKIKAAYAIASCIKDEELREDYIIPSIFNETVTKKVSQAIIKAYKEDKDATL